MVQWRLDVGHTWSGDQAVLEDTPSLQLEVRESRVEIQIQAPWRRDPPPPGPARALEGLWNYEVVELFVAERFPTAAVHYTELEFSPHGHWLAWTFCGPRQRSGDDPDLEFEAHRDRDRWHGRARLDLDALPEPPWSLFAAAVDGASSRRRYLVSHPLPGGTPDFHQPAHYPPAERFRVEPRPLEAAYRHTSYQVDRPEGPLTLRIGRRHEELDRWLAQAGAWDWSFLTAWNPKSVPTAATANLEAMKRLQERLSADRYSFVAGTGNPDHPDWSPEPSVFVLDLGPAAALTYARRFGQHAVVQGRRGGLPYLLWTEL